MNGVPANGDHITIRWPGGLHDFSMEFIRLYENMPAATDPYLWLSGIVGYRDIGRPGVDTLHIPLVQTLYARPIGDGEYEMLPRVS